MNGEIKAEEQDRRETSPRHCEASAVGGSQKAVLQMPKALLPVVET